MIDSKSKLKFYIMADTIMNTSHYPPHTPTNKIKNWLFPNPILQYLKTMRKLDYYTTIHSYKKFYYKWLFQKQGQKLGFSIGFNSFGYGLVLPHYGTIVVGGSNRIGNYAVVHTSTCITDNGKVIGDCLYVGTGAKLTSKLVLGSNVSIGANSVVNKSFPEGNMMIAGAPAKKIKDAEAWYIRDGLTYQQKVEAVEALKQKMNIE